MRLKTSIEWMLLFADKKKVFSKKENKSFSFYLNFITLNLPEAQKHSDSYIINHILQPFLDWYRRNYSYNYVWKAETQQNGNIHFHVTTDTFIHWKSIRKKWNKLLAKNGYSKAFDDRNELGPNSIDVHAVKNAESTARYMAKYMMKKAKPEKLSDPHTFWSNHYYQEEIPQPFEKEPGVWMIEKRKLHCRIWAASQSLSNLHITSNDLKHSDFVDYSFGASDMADKTIRADFATVYLYKHLKYNSKKFPQLRQCLEVLYRRRKIHSKQQKFFTVASFN